MTYWLLDTVFLLPAAAAWITALVRQRAHHGSARGMVAASLQGAVVLLALTCIFDNAMIAAGLFGYRPDTISGLKIGLAPLEDLAYPLAAVLLLPGLWLMMGQPSPELQEGQEGSND